MEDVITSYNALINRLQNIPLRDPEYVIEYNCFPEIIELIDPDNNVIYCTEVKQFSDCMIDDVFVNLINLTPEEVSTITKFQSKVLDTIDDVLGLEFNTDNVELNSISGNYWEFTLSYDSGFYNNFLFTTEQLIIFLERFVKNRE